MLVKQIILILLISLVITQRLPSPIQKIVTGNYTVSINTVGGSFKILANHKEEISFNPQNLIEKDLTGLAITNRTVDLRNKLFSVFEASYNETHPVKFIRITSENLTPGNNQTATVFKTTITLRKYARNLHYAEAPSGSFEISHEIVNWRSCQNTGSVEDAPECFDAERRNINETFIDFNLNINHPNSNLNQSEAIHMSYDEDAIRLHGFDHEEFTFKDSYNVLPVISLKPEWETGYPMLLSKDLSGNNDTNSDTGASSKASSLSKVSEQYTVSRILFRFKKPNLEKNENNQIWFNYLYYNTKPLMEQVTLESNKNSINHVMANFKYNGISLDSREENIFLLKFLSVMVKSADGLYYLNDSRNLINLNNNFFVLKEAEKTSYQNNKVIEAYGSMGNILENTLITVKVLIFLEDGRIKTLNGEHRTVISGDVKVAFEVENFPFKNEGDSLELVFSIIHPHELKVIDESNNWTAKYAKGQTTVERWVKNDNKDFKMDSQYPKLSFDDDRVTLMNVNLGRFTQKSEFELFLHPAKLNELVPIRRFDTTNYMTDLGGNIKALAYHYVECKENEVLSFWNMKSSSGKIAIEYYCISFLSVEKNYVWRYTNWNDINDKQDKSANFLDRHRILCDADESIGAFVMEKSANNIRFKYRCNKTVNVSTGSRVTAWERIGEGQIYNLKEHYLFATKKEDTLNVLRGWKMSARYINKWCTVFCDNYQEIRFEIFYSTLKDYEDHI
jgi:hypothetical protein